MMIQNIYTRLPKWIAMISTDCLFQHSSNIHPICLSFSRLLSLRIFLFDIIVTIININSTNRFISYWFGISHKTMIYAVRFYKLLLHLTSNCDSHSCFRSRTNTNSQKHTQPVYNYYETLICCNWRCKSRTFMIRYLANGCIWLQSWYKSIN